jgi:hypothetical protein
MGCEGGARGAIQAAGARGEWARRRMADLEAIYGESLRASSSDVLEDLRAERI